MALEVIITSGGTISKLDDVRHIGNFSRGTTGALIGEEFLKSGATVHYVHGKNAQRPFRSALVVDPAKPKEEELERVAKAYDEFNQYADRLHEHAIETFEEYYNTVQRLLTNNSPDAIVLAAAVGDYGGTGQEGKISSDEEFLTIELPKNPKVISLVKQWNPRVFQVGFKLLSRSTLDNLIDVAYQHGIKNHSNLTVANTLIYGDFKKRATVFITPEKGLIPVSLSELAPRLVELVNQRVSKKHYRTRINKESAGRDYRLELSGEISSFRGYIRKLWQLNLFEPYFDNADMHFGFLATRVAQGGFLITSRGSNKKHMPLEDIVYIPKVDFDNRTVYVNSLGKKASLNANVAAKIFEERPDVSVILHAHVSLGIENKTSIDYSPGTQEDVDEVIAHLRDGQKIVELINHGIISVGANLNDVIGTLDVEPSYANFPELYDTIYPRFQLSADFIDLVERISQHDESVLDLGAGTGYVAIQLIERGYKDISLADKSAGMLRVAKEKIGSDVPAYITTMQNLKLGKTYDVISIRQAINYVMDYEGLVNGLTAMHEHLNSGGRLVFNTPNFNGETDYGEKSLEYECEGYNVKVRELNLVEGKIITHTQHCVLMKKDCTDIKKVYDFNRFGLFTKNEFESALHEAGYSSIQFFGKGLSDFTQDSKTLYCVATK